MSRGRVTATRHRRIAAVHGELAALTGSPVPSSFASFIRRRRHSGTLAADGPLQLAMLRRLLPVLLFTVLGAAPAGAADGLPSDITSLADPVPIAAFRGHLVFSRVDAEGRFELVQRVGDGPVRPVGVPTRSVPFDVDVGPTDSGRILAVYSRCATEASYVRRFASFRPPDYRDGKGCDIYKADLATGEETRFSAVSSSRATEYWPTYWKGRIGFARVYDAKRSYPYLYVKTVASRRPSQRMPGGQRKLCFPSGPCTNDTLSNPSELELYGSRLAFVWRYQGEGEGLTDELRVDTVGGGHRRLDEVRSGSITAIVVGWPSFEGGRLFWTRACFGNSEGCPGRSRLVKSTYVPPIITLSGRDPRSLYSYERDDLASTFLLGTTLGCQDDPPGPTPLCRVTTTRPDFAPLAEG